jgi:hypothetical protein
MPVTAVPNLPALQASIKKAFDNAITAAGGTPGPDTSAINTALAKEISKAINSFVEAALVTVTVSTSVSAISADGSPVAGTGTGTGVS